MKTLVGNMIDALKGQPLALALVAINLIFMFGVIAATERKDALVADLVKHCLDKK